MTAHGLNYLILCAHHLVLEVLKYLLLDVSDPAVQQGHQLYKFIRLSNGRLPFLVNVLLPFVFALSNFIYRGHRHYLPIDNDLLLAVFSEGMDLRSLKARYVLEMFLRVR